MRIGGSRPTAASLAQDPSGATLALVTTVERENVARWLYPRTGAERAMLRGLPLMRVEPVDVGRLLGHR